MVYTASLSATEPTPPLGAYSASKAALVMLASQLAYEWGADGIRVNCVSPGMVRTPLTEKVYDDPARSAQRAAQIPAGRIAEPVDLARAIAFLGSDSAGYVNGVNLIVDGGLRTALMPTIRGMVSV